MYDENNKNNLGNSLNDVNSNLGNNTDQFQNIQNNQTYNQMLQNNNQMPQNIVYSNKNIQSPQAQNKSSGLGIAALIFSILGCTFFIGLILAIIDLTNKDGKNKTISKIALGICGVWLLLSGINIVKRRVNKTEKGSDIITTETAVQETETTEAEVEVSEDNSKSVKGDSQITEDSQTVSDVQKHTEIKNDFDAEKATDVCEIGGYSIKIPNYYFIDNDEDKTGVIEYYVLEDSKKVAIIDYIFGNDIKDYSNRNQDYADIIDKSFYGSELEDINISGMKAVEYKGYYKANENDKETEDYEGGLLVLYDEINNNNIVAFFIQESDSKFDYYNDFKKSLETIEYTGATTESEGTKADGELDQDFKEFMDSYEAFVDEYVDFMQKMKDDPSDLTLLSEMTDYMTKLTDFNTKLQKLDNDELSDAEMNYYIEVTTRCSEKMLKAGISY
jgi:hypothetical protein